MRPVDADALMAKLNRKKAGPANQRYTEGFNDCLMRVRSMVHSAPTLTPPNEPLTLEQLREMDGEPVWFDTIKRWGIVKVCQDGTFLLTKSGEFEVGYITRRKYYRRPPERQEDT